MKKRDRLALRPAVGMLALFLVTLGAIAALLSAGVSQVIVPAPEGVAEQFLRALAAHNYEAAHGQLAEGLRGDVSPDDLQAAVAELQAKAGGIEDAHGEEGDAEGENATARATVKLGDNTSHELEFSLQREHGLWRLASVDSLLALARQ